MTKHVRVAVCGHLPTACDYLLQQGVVQIDRYMDATELTDETAYHLILIYAPNAEGLLDTQFSRCQIPGKAQKTIPIRLLNEPCCHSALLELRSIVRRISASLRREQISASAGE
jgi:hypothetical protein